MKTAGEISRQLSSAKALKGPEKLRAFTGIREEIRGIELSAIRDWTSVSLEDIRKIPSLIQECDASISRIEAGLRRRQTAAVDDGI